MKIKITDFGFSTIFDPEKKDLSLKIGSGLYQAPELFSKGTFTEKIDIWSIGVLTYTMIGGAGIFPFETIEEVQKKPVDFDPEHFPEITDMCRDFIQKCLNKK